MKAYKITKKLGGPSLKMNIKDISPLPRPRIPCNFFRTIHEPQIIPAQLLLAEPEPVAGPGQAEPVAVGLEPAVQVAAGPGS